MDPFHESNDDSRIDYAEAARVLLKAMRSANPKATWVVQGWTENPRPQMLDALQEGDILILDLFSECRPMWGAPSIWKREKGYGNHQWLFCLLENFGANVGLHGRMDQLIDNFYMTKTHPLARKIKGIGFTMEGSGNNPVMFELMSELPWLPQRITKEEWLRGYVKARYGFDDPEVQKAWLILARSIYNCPVGNNQQGPHESIFCGRPTLHNFQASSWSKMKNYYDPEDTRQAASLMAGVAEKYRGNNNFEYDLVDIVRQAVADQARIQYQRTIADYKAFSRSAFKEDAGRFLQMLDMQDQLLGSRREFRVGNWLEDARRCGVTAEEKDLYEWNARVQITTWGNRYCADTGGLRDYAHKEWQGLLADFYAVRWKAYFDALDRQILRRAQDAYAEVIGKASATLATGAIDLRQAVNGALEDFAKRGIAGFVDAAGRCWEMSTYAEMATLTAIERATRYGYVDTMQEYGHDLAIISSHAGACPLCVDWENVVVSVSGTNPDYPSLDDAEASGCFHPRCLHDISTYYGDLDGRKDIARSEPGHSETPSAAYTARSKQRAYERQIRAWKRVESACKAAGNPQRERAAYNHVRMFQAKIRDLRSAYNANTPRSTDWLPRKYDREGGRLTLSKAALKANTK